MMMGCLSLARSLQLLLPHIDVTVFERSPVIRPGLGGSFDISGGGDILVLSNGTWKPAGTLQLGKEVIADEYEFDGVTQVFRWQRVRWKQTWWSALMAFGLRVCC